ncbi:restriction endonuclease [Bifidobacterium samirii]|uniref:Restriction endonuclease n=1 Tax=Bifidobacterium samirii TaxID=2306974 RepID=A0A430FTN8_9BIFI|nr:restriction endonuclease [Bifidobacterium samirii]RSX56260.1 Restriction endonuclease [Bifidobacterium samirii]
MTAWMIRAGRGGVYAADWVDRGLIGIGWDYKGQDITRMTRDELKDTYREMQPSASSNQVGAAVGQSWHFAQDMKEGSTIVLYDPAERKYHIGEVTGDCVPVEDDDSASYVRTVKWTSDKNRDDLSGSAKNSLGSITTIFKVKDEVLKELESEQPVADSESRDGDDSDEAMTDAIFASYDDGIERIKDRIRELGWADMELLTAGLLRALGYHASVTPKGADGGRDIIAGPDPLGMEPPRIIVEVKHRQHSMGAQEVRAFVAGLRDGDRGLYVSTGGFSREARYEADRANIPVRLVNLDDFARLYTEAYDRMEPGTRALLPLTRIWWPADE